MFGARRRIATEAAVGGVLPIINTLRHLFGLPPGFWDDPYVLGFMNFMIGSFAKLATDGKIAGSEHGYVLVDAYAALSNQNGAPIVRRATALAMSNDADFNKGADDAAAVQFYTMRVLKNEASNELVRRATALAEQDRDSLIEGDERSRVAAMMVMLSLVSEVRSRFSLP